MELLSGHWPFLAFCLFSTPKNTLIRAWPRFHFPRSGFLKWVHPGPWLPSPHTFSWWTSWKKGVQCLIPYIWILHLRGSRPWRRRLALLIDFNICLFFFFMDLMEEILVSNVMLYYLDIWIMFDQNVCLKIRSDF